MNPNTRPLMISVLLVLSVALLVLAFTDVSDSVFYFLGGIAFGTTFWCWWFRAYAQRDEGGSNDDL